MAKKPAAKKPAKKAPPAKPMTKAEIVAAVAEATETTKANVEAVYAALLDVIAEGTKKGPFILPHFGKLEIITRSERKGRNPQTGEEMTIPAKPALKITISKQLKDKVLA